MTGTFCDNYYQIETYFDAINKKKAELVSVENEIRKIWSLSSSFEDCNKVLDQWTKVMS